MQLETVVKLVMERLVPPELARVETVEGEEEEEDLESKRPLAATTIFPVTDCK